GAEATRRGEVPQADGVPGQPGPSAGADQQPCRAGQPDVPTPGESAVQVASASDAGSLRGPDVGQYLEGTRHSPPGGDRWFKSDRGDQDARRDEKTAFGRMKTRWCSARSLV